MNQNYDDILYLPRHISKTRKPMSNLNRAAQFAPFAALSGHEDAVKETARITDEKILLDESKIEQINQKLQFIDEFLLCEYPLSFTIFQPDPKKKGGKYITLQGKVKKIDSVNQRLVLMDQSIIKIEDIYAIDGDWFEQ